MNKRGHYVVFEGCEGCGKTTQISLLEKYLLEKGIDCKSVNEPGGTPLGRKIRIILLDYRRKLSPLTQLLLFEVARLSLHNQEIIPSLKKGQTIISDRSKYSSLAYQGYGGNMNLTLIKTLNYIATRGTKPDLTYILDIDSSVGLKREKVFTSFSNEDLEYHQRVRQGFLEIAKENSDCVIIPYVDGVEKMQDRIRAVVDKRLNL